MSRTRLFRWSAALASVLALSTVAAQASHDGGGYDRSPRPDRMLVVTTSQNQLLRLNARNPDRIRDIQAITGLPAGVTLRGIDFRPKTGDLYGVGSDSVVYRVNPNTGIAIAEGPAFTPGAAREGVRRRLQPGRGQDPRRQRRPPEPAPERRRGHRAEHGQGPQPRPADGRGRRLRELVVQLHAARGDDAARGRRGQRHAVHAGPAERRHAHERQASSASTSASTPGSTSRAATTSAS